MKGGTVPPCVLILAVVIMAPPISAQRDLPAASLSSDTITVGDVFELQVRLPIPPGSVVYVPDSLPATFYMESFSAVSWEVEPTLDGGATLLLNYPLIAFSAGNLPVPGLDIFTAPISDTAGDSLPGGSILGAWEDAPRGPGGGLFTTRIPRLGLWVEPVLTAEDFAQGAEPKPADDVLGSNWNWPAVALMGLFSTILGGVVVTTTREWLSTRSLLAKRGEQVVPITVAEARLKALHELDQLLNSRSHERGEIHQFYEQSSGIVRAYVERIDPEWGPDLTSSELMRNLTETDFGTIDLLNIQMQIAEVVKFGRLRPSAPEAEGHVEALRLWVDTSQVDTLDEVPA